MTLKKKILLGYGVAFLLMSLVAALAISNLWLLGRTTDTVLRDYYRSILAVENMLDALGRQDSGILLVFMGEAAKGISQYGENEALFLEWLGRSKESVAVEGELEIIHAIELQYSEYRSQFMRLTDLQQSERSSLPLSLQTYKETILPVFNQVKTSCLELRTMNEKTMYSVSENARKGVGHAIWSTVAIAVLASMAALFFSLVFAERLVLPLRRFVEAAKKIATGEFSVQLSVETKDELGVLAQEFNRMADQLRQYHTMNVDRIVAEKNKGEAVLASIEDGLVVFDTDRKVTAINPAARRILKVKSAVGETLDFEQILPDKKIFEIIDATIKSGAQPNISDDQRIVILTSEEEMRHYLFSVTVVGQKDEKLTSVVLLLKDITQLREVERLKSEFVMAASHELRTPLTSLGMSIELLIEHARQFLPDKERELLQAAHDEVNRMKALVHDLLDLSKIEAGRIELEFEIMPIATLFEHARNIFKGQVSMKHINLTIDDTEFLPLVRADANKIVWVLSNLISNALRYVFEGGHIRLTAEKSGAMVNICVQDDGIGIPFEHQIRIFQKFVQLNKRESGRTGLGLAISREIVRAHGGIIWVESYPGKGSVFTFTLPAVS